MKAPPVILLLRRETSGKKTHLFFGGEITWIPWMELSSPWSGRGVASRVGFQYHPPFQVSPSSPAESQTRELLRTPCVYMLVHVCVCERVSVCFDYSIKLSWLTWTRPPSMRNHNTTHWGSSTACRHLSQRSSTSENRPNQLNLYLSMTVKFHNLDEHFYQVRRWETCIDSTQEY